MDSRSLGSRWLPCFVVVVVLLCGVGFTHPVSGRSTGEPRSLTVSLNDYGGARANPGHEPKPKAVPKLKHRA
uniref:Uncharacterized protein n=1 Tax=Musa acuminata subsp. malaccensis TaxID=214687 RepID=A0A804JAB5_MUSAM